MHAHNGQFCFAVLGLGLTFCVLCVLCRLLSDKD